MPSKNPGQDVLIPFRIPPDGKGDSRKSVCHHQVSSTRLNGGNSDKDGLQFNWQFNSARTRNNYKLHAKH